MATQINTRVYRPSQVASKPELQARFVRVVFSSGQKKMLVLAAGLAVVVGLTAPKMLAGRIDAARVKAQQLQAVNATISNENVRLLAARAQLASKTHIMALAERKLRLFEPVKGQVHRM